MMGAAVLDAVLELLELGIGTGAAPLSWVELDGRGPHAASATEHTNPSRRPTPNEYAMHPRRRRSFWEAAVGLNEPDAIQVAEAHVLGAIRGEAVADRERSRNSRSM